MPASDFYGQIVSTVWFDRLPGRRVLDSRTAPCTLVRPEQFCRY